MSCKTFDEAIMASTCQKRITIVELYDSDGNLLVRESNRCKPTGGHCHRIGLVQNKSNYDGESSCNWTHAEIMALSALTPGQVPVKAVLYGHDFYCQPCEDQLKLAGCQILEIARKSIL